MTGNHIITTYNAIRRILALVAALLILLPMGAIDAHAYRRIPIPGCHNCFTYYFARDEIISNRAYFTSGTISCFSDNHVDELLRTGRCSNVTGDIFILEGWAPTPSASSQPEQRSAPGIDLTALFGPRKPAPREEYRFNGTTTLADGSVTSNPAPPIMEAPTETEKSRACILETQDFLTREGALAAKKLEVRQKVEGAITVLDPAGALLLKLSSGSWNKESSGNVAQVLCAIDDFKATAEAYENSATRDTANVNPETRLAYDLSGDSLRASLGYLAETSRAVKDSTVFTEKQEMFEFAKATGEVLLDLATSLTPGVSTGRDAYEAFTGKNLLTQEELTTFERSVAVLCVASLGTGSIVKGALKGVERIAGLAKIGHKVETAEHSLKNSIAAVDAVTEWVGKDAKFMRNKYQDVVILSKDETRKVRFDIKHTTPHSNPHAHAEELVNGKWVKSGPIYPTDVPHN